MAAKNRSDEKNEAQEHQEFMKAGPSLGEPKFKIEWLDQTEENVMGTAAGSHLDRTTIDQEHKKVKFNPFISNKKEQTVDYSITELTDAFENGDIELNDYIEALNRIYRVNHSVGADILDDQRLRVDTRISRYVEWAAAQGENPEEAARFAALYIGKKGAERGTLAGNWGTVTSRRNIQKKK
jgi:hypothetical protein